MKKLTLSLITFLVFLSVFSQNTTTFTGAVSIDWHDANNWTNGVPDATKTAIVTAGSTVHADATITAGGITNSGTMHIYVCHDVNAGSINNSGSIYLGNNKIKGIGEGKININNSGNIVGDHDGKYGRDINFDNVGTFSNSGVIDVNRFWMDDVDNFVNQESGEISSSIFNICSCSDFGNTGEIVSRGNLSIASNYSNNNGLLRSKFGSVSVFVKKDYCRQGSKSQIKAMEGRVFIDGKKGDLTGRISSGTTSKSNIGLGTVSIVTDTCWVVGDSVKIEGETLRFVFDQLDFLSIDSIKSIYANSKIEFYGTAGSMLSIIGWVEEDFIYVENGNIEIHTDSIRIFDHDINYYCYPNPLVGPADTTFIQSYIESVNILDSVTKSGSIYIDIRSNCTGRRSFDYDISSKLGWVENASGSTQVLAPFQFDSLLVNYSIPVTGDTLTDTIMVVLSIPGEYSNTVYSYLYSDKDMTVQVDEIIANKHNFQLMVSPNPSEGVVNITASEDAEIYVFDLNGNLINHFNLNQNTHKCLNSNYSMSPGLYFIQGSSGCSIITEKLIIR
jgi:type IX secretion system substrate protein